MEPVTMGLMAGAALAPVVASLIGRAMAAGDIAEAKRLERQALEELNIPLPDLQQAVAEQQGNSELGNVQLDPRFQQAQLEALDAYGRASRGDDMQYRAAMDRARRDTGQEAASRFGMIQQQMQSRGLGGSGMEWAAKMQANQDAAERHSGFGFNAAAEGQRRALDAYGQQAGLAGRMQGDEYNRKAQFAAAQDRINQFNAANKQQSQMYNLGLNQDRFNNQMRMADARQKALMNQAQSLRGSAQDTQQAATGVGQGLGQASAAFGNKSMEDQEYLKWLRSKGGQGSGGVF